MNSLSHVYVFSDIDWFEQSYSMASERSFTLAKYDAHKL